MSENVDRDLYGFVPGDLVEVRNLGGWHYKGHVTEIRDYGVTVMAVVVVPPPFSRRRDPIVYELPLSNLTLLAEAGSNMPKKPLEIRPLLKEDGDWPQSLTPPFTMAYWLGGMGGRLFPMDDYPPGTTLVSVPQTARKGAVTFPARYDIMRDAWIAVGDGAEIDWGERVATLPL